MSDSLGTLLVVDDVAMNRDLLQRRLTRRGYEVTLAENGAEALDLVSKESFDLILLDVMMPDIDGMQVLKEIRDTQTRLQLPVIMVTAKDDSKDIIEALKAGANDYVTKPLDLEVLLARIGTHVILKRTTASLEAANQRLKRDLEAAARIQQANLPEKSPRLGSCQFAWSYVPCEELAGDYLNVVALNENHAAFYLLDVSGHGVQAALLAVAINHMLSPSRGDTSVVNRPNRNRIDDSDETFLVTPPEEVAEKLNRRFPFDPAAGQFFTILYGVVNLDTGECRYVSTGHPSPIYLPADGPPRLLESKGTPVGIVQADDPDFEPYQALTLTLNPGDRILLYSDGLVEAMDKNDQAFGLNRLTDAFVERRQAPLDENLESIMKEVDIWLSGMDARDDLSLLALEWSP